MKKKNPLIAYKWINTNKDALSISNVPRSPFFNPVKFKKLFHIIDTPLVSNSETMNQFKKGTFLKYFALITWLHKPLSKRLCHMLFMHKAMFKPNKFLIP